MFQEALDKARDLDAEFAKTGELVGPLHGVPFSVKDHIQTKGVSTTLLLPQSAFLSHLHRSHTGPHHSRLYSLDQKPSFGPGRRLYRANLLIARRNPLVQDQHPPNDAFLRMRQPALGPYF